MVNTQKAVKKIKKNVSQFPNSYKKLLADALKKHLLEDGISIKSLVSSIKSLSGYSPSIAYLSNIQNGKFKIGNTLIADKDFKVLGDYFKIAFEKKIWNTVETDSFLDCFGTFQKARKVQSPICLYGDTGTGKTTAAIAYKKEFSKNTFYVRCKHSMTKKEFVEQLCKSANVPYQASSARSMSAIANKLKGIQKPLFIIDEAEHLNSSKFNLLKGLYDDLTSGFGMVLIMATADFKRFVRKAQKGIGTFPQIFSRLAGASRAIMPFDISEDLPFLLTALGILNSKWFTKSAYNWLIDRGDVKDLRILSTRITQAYAEFEETQKPINSDDMEILFPSLDF